MDASTFEVLHTSVTTAFRPSSSSDPTSLLYHGLKEHISEVVLSFCDKQVIVMEKQLKAMSKQLKALKNAGD